MPLSKRKLNLLSNEINKHNLKSIFTNDKKFLFKYSYDNSKISFLPIGVFQPKKSREVQEILKIANKYKIPVVCRGSGSVPTGAASAINDSWIIDLSYLNKITIDTKERLAIVESGAIIQDIKNNAEKQGLFYPPDPSSKKFATIGGSINTNAGGLMGAKYGVTRDYVIALEGYLANSSPFKYSLPLRKFTVGYNLKDLVIGSEGTLVIITKIYLKLIPQKKYKLSSIAYFSKNSYGIKTINYINKSVKFPIPVILEFLNLQTISCLKYAFKNNFKIPKKTKNSILFEFDADSKSEMNKYKRKLKKLLKKYSFNFSIKPNNKKNKSEIEKMWHIRRTCSQSMYCLKNSKLNQDIVIPRKKLKSLINFSTKLEKSFNLPIPVFGHAGDGNLHVNILYDKDNKAESLRAKNAQNALMDFVVDIGGAISGEHGIGLTKSKFFHLHHNKETVKLMKSIKKCFDPNNILNRGKIFNSIDTWDLPRVNVKMPWDSEINIKNN